MDRLFESGVRSIAAPESLYRVGAYIRLSMEDASYDSDSVENQREMLSGFIAMMPGWVEHRFYIDNGYSGGTFQRPAFQELMDDIRAGQVNLFLVKDLSRFGRNYLEAGHYLEEELPALGCRFVALADGVDTDNGENDIVPFLNAINDYYLKSLSDRIRSVMAAKARDGQKISGHAPYGYRRDPADHTRLVVDEYAAGIVRRIFAMRAQGAGYGRIVKALNRDGILPPLLYYYEVSGRDGSGVKTRHWTSSTVQSLVRKELYIGNANQLVKKVVSHRDRREIRRAEDEQVRVENAFPAIIDRDTWEAAQEINRGASARFADKSGPRKHLFQGYLVCAGCGTRLCGLAFPREYKGKRSVYVAYWCGANHATCGAACTSHNIPERALKQVVLAHIRQMSERIALDEDAMLRSLRSRLIRAGEDSRAELAKEQRVLSGRLHQLELLTARLYEDRVAGMVAEDSFFDLLETYETERLEKEKRLALITQTEQEAAAKLNDFQVWMRLIRENAAAADVDRELLETLVERIEVGEAQVVDGQKYQDIRIVYRFVGVVEVSS